MSFEVSITPDCLKQLKRLSRKYPSLKSDVARLVDSLTENPTEGTALGRGFHKVRLAIRSKEQGRSGGARVITYVVITDRHVYLAAIYDKSERATLTDKELKELAKGFGSK